MSLHRIGIRRDTGCAGMGAGRKKVDSAIPNVSSSCHRTGRSFVTTELVRVPGISLGIKRIGTLSCGCQPPNIMEINVNVKGHNGEWREK